MYEETKHVWVNAITPMHGLHLFSSRCKKFSFSQLKYQLLNNISTSVITVKCINF